jgi:hypothetical protein
VDYGEVDRIINEHGFSAEPAFSDVTVAIRPIPEMDGCPLGLYYPASGTIVIPPDGYPSVILHELGHRYGHYYYNNLSEQFAESFRKRYQGGTAVMYAGRDFARLPKMGSLFEEGEPGAFAMWTEGPVSPQALATLKEYFAACSCGEPPPQVFYNGDNINVKFVKGVDWPVIFTGGLAALATVGAAAIAYAIYKTAKDSPWVFPLIVFGGIAGAILIGRAITGRTTRSRALARA